MFASYNHSGRPPVFNFIDSKNEELTLARLHEKKKNLMYLKIIKKKDMARVMKTSLKVSTSPSPANSPKSSGASAFQNFSQKILNIIDETPIIYSHKKCADDMYRTKYNLKSHDELEIERLRNTISNWIKKIKNNKGNKSELNVRKISHFIPKSKKLYLLYFTQIIKKRMINLMKINI
jgi:hypothetical protein